MDVIIAELCEDNNDEEGWECRLCGDFIPHSLPHSNDHEGSEYAIEGSRIREHLRVIHGINMATIDDVCYIITNKLLEIDEEKEHKCKPA